MALEQVLVLLGRMRCSIYVKHSERQHTNRVPTLMQKRANRSGGFRAVLLCGYGYKRRIYYIVGFAAWEDGDLGMSAAGIHLCLKAVRPFDICTRTFRDEQR